MLIDGESDGFLGGIAEINPNLLIVILLLVASLIGLLIFGLRSPKVPQESTFTIKTKITKLLIVKLE